MSMHLTPIEVVERLIAPVEDLGELAGLNAKAAYHWRSGSKVRDPGDIPVRHARRFLDHSDRHGLGLTAQHLIRGATEAEIDAILNARVGQARAVKRVAAK